MSSELTHCRLLLVSAVLCALKYNSSYNNSKTRERGAQTREKLSCKVQFRYFSYHRMSFLSPYDHHHVIVSTILLFFVGNFLNRVFCLSVVTFCPGESNNSNFTLELLLCPRRCQISTGSNFCVSFLCYVDKFNFFLAFSDRIDCIRSFVCCTAVKCGVRGSRGWQKNRGLFESPLAPQEQLVWAHIWTFLLLMLLIHRQVRACRKKNCCVLWTCLDGLWTHLHCSSILTIGEGECKGKLGLWRRALNSR